MVRSVEQRPSRTGVQPEPLKVLPQKVAADSLQVVLQQFGQFHRLLFGAVHRFPNCLVNVKPLYRRLSTPKHADFAAIASGQQTSQVLDGQREGDY